MNEKKENTSLYNNKDFKTVFQRASSEMIATNTKAYGGEWADRFLSRRLHDYTPEQVDRIINSGSLIEQQRLSRNYFEKDGFYRKLVLYYASLYLYYGILIPNPKYNKNLSMEHIQKRYFNAVEFTDKVNLPDLLLNCATNALVDGCYYGIFQSVDKNGIATLDLPVEYCCSRYKDKQGRDLIEFDVRFFDTIKDEDVKKATLRAYPNKVRNWYYRWKRGEVSSHWAFIPADSGICFPMFDSKPLFLNVIPACINYDQAVDVEKERDLEEIRKIIVQQIPHLQDGTLLFEPDEVAVMHQGTVDMLKGNPNVSVLTSYGTVDSIVSKTASDTASNNLEKMMKNIYYEAGTSSQIFSADSNLAIETSIANDMSTLSYLIYKFNNFVTNLVNRLFANGNVSFNYIILPITHYNRTKFIEDAFKLAMSGYSYLLPAIAMGVPQSSLRNLKILENELLDLGDILIPLSSAYTAASDGAGRPQKEDGEKSSKTEQNEVSLENQGGSTN